MMNFIKSECRVYKDEIIFDNWIKALEKKLGFKVNPNGQAFDLYKDGCDLDDAAEEIKFAPY